MRDIVRKLENARKWIPTVSHFFLLTRVAAWSFVVPFLLKYLSMDKLMKVLTPRKPKSIEADMETARLLNVYVSQSLRVRPENRGKMCLKRSLVLYRFLRMYNIPARLMVGVRKEQGELTGHSWIEIHGRHFQDPLEDVKYSVTFSYPEGPGKIGA